MLPQAGGLYQWVLKDASLLPAAQHRIGLRRVMRCFASIVLSRDFEVCKAALASPSHPQIESHSRRFSLGDLVYSASVVRKQLLSVEHRMIPSPPSTLPSLPSTDGTPERNAPPAAASSSSPGGLKVLSDKRIALLHPVSFEGLVLQHGVWMAGGCLVPLLLDRPPPQPVTPTNPVMSEKPNPSWEYALAESRVSMAIVHPAWHPLLQPVCSLLAIPCFVTSGSRLAIEGELSPLQGALLPPTQKPQMVFPPSASRGENGTKRKRKSKGGDGGTPEAKGWSAVFFCAPRSHSAQEKIAARLKEGKYRGLEGALLDASLSQHGKEEAERETIKGKSPPCLHLYSESPLLPPRAAEHSRRSFRQMVKSAASALCLEKGTGEHVDGRSARQQFHLLFSAGGGGGGAGFGIWATEAALSTGALLTILDQGRGGDPFHLLDVLRKSYREGRPVTTLVVPESEAPRILSALDHEDVTSSERAEFLDLLASCECICLVAELSRIRKWGGVNPPFLQGVFHDPNVDPLNGVDLHRLGMEGRERELERAAREEGKLSFPLRDQVENCNAKVVRVFVCAEGGPVVEADEEKARPFVSDDGLGLTGHVEEGRALPGLDFDFEASSGQMKMKGEGLFLRYFGRERSTVEAFDADGHFLSELQGRREEHSSPSFSITDNLLLQIQPEPSLRDRQMESTEKNLMKAHVEGWMPKIPVQRPTWRDHHNMFRKPWARHRRSKWFY
uniref:AMP-dependent synthetase/ligase domain-containing protein n=1 Tax=Chromera velia CCMP2878 TaxID=1169474 RepID=A0A0G4IBA3_9ALVE|eukprot:Cvel_2155.t1-p1 / transcript=Cvel_2155.t1 / gene=Cvel_2155 / organism=Chromera_velia_CCMP2878 / gene_product=hypothetical protein / transcript_product=hypothetical protein / location=Cvel_scaffold83:128945-135288(-) / protein_length=728 / sequence_SO=supercontig / SO=protein_coding / is_pseudo=false